jgi:hypothetical protein
MIGNVQHRPHTVKYSVPIASITLYNHYHNGDLFVSKQFVKQFVQQFAQYSHTYCHFNHPKTLQDLAIAYEGPPHAFAEKSPWSVNHDQLAINTWVGVYQSPCDPPAFYQGGINLRILHSIWSYLSEQLTAILGTPFHLSNNLMDYVPEIDYSQYNVSSVDDYVAARSRKRVLFCNGAAMSGQSFAHNLSDLIQWFADRYPQVDFVCTAKFVTDRHNIMFTDDICTVEQTTPAQVMYWNQNINRCDLNEISYLSTHCDLIVGKNSGPFVYCLTKQNVNNAAKTFISFNTVAADNLLYGMNTACTYIQTADFEPHHMAQLIDSKLCQF